MPRCAFLTLADPTGYVMDDDLAAAPLAALGWSLDTIPWNRPGVDWRDYDFVVIRSTWDYQHHVDAFLATLDAIAASGVPLQNSPALVRWNLRKTYLRELADAGLHCMPTLWRERLAPGELATLFDGLDAGEIVVKPVVSATAEGAFRLDRAAARTRAAEVEDYYADRALLAQPFQAEVLGAGEYSLFYFDGRYSHAVRKQPKPGDFRVQEEHGGLISALQPGPALRAAADAAMAALAEVPLYARVDLVDDGAGGHWLMEFELIEPSLYLRMDPGAPARLAQAIVARARR